MSGTGGSTGSQYAVAEAEEVAISLNIDDKLPGHFQKGDMEDPIRAVLQEHGAYKPAKYDGCDIIDGDGNPVKDATAKEVLTGKAELPHGLERRIARDVDAAPFLQEYLTTLRSFIDKLDEVTEGEYGETVTGSHSRLTTAAPEELSWVDGREVSSAVRVFDMYENVYEQIDAYGLNGLERRMERDGHGSTLKSEALDTKILHESTDTQDKEWYGYVWNQYELAMEELHAFENALIDGFESADDDLEALRNLYRTVVTFERSKNRELLEQDNREWIRRRQDEDDVWSASVRDSLVHLSE